MYLKTQICFLKSKFAFQNANFKNQLKTQICVKANLFFKTQICCSKHKFQKANLRLENLRFVFEICSFVKANLLFETQICVSKHKF